MDGKSDFEPHASAKGCVPHSQQSGLVQLYKELHSSLMRFAFRYFKRPQDIEDVVQEAFVKVIEAQQDREIRHLRSYMYQTVKNLSLKKLDKSEYRLTETVGEFTEDMTALLSISLEEQFESRQKMDLFCQTVRRLPKKCQRSYILRRVYGLSYKEIAEKMDISVKTVEHHLTKAALRCTLMIDEMNATPLEQTPQKSRGGQL